MAATAARGQAPASAATAPATVKYYIVPPPARGAVPTLYSIAAATLGNGSLYMEIFKLNKGRLQPNGQRLENPHSVEPGWLLLLPPGASGPGVHSGPLARGGQGHLAGSTPDVPRRQARAAASPAAASAGYGSGTIAETVIGGALLVFAVAGLGLVMRRRRRAGGASGRKPTHTRGSRPRQRLGPRPGRGHLWRHRWSRRRGCRCGRPARRTPTPRTGPRASPAVPPVPARGARCGRPGLAVRRPLKLACERPRLPTGRPAPTAPTGPIPTTRPGPPSSPGRPLTPDHPSWPATDLGRPVGTAADYGRPAGADRPGWPYPDHPSWPASDAWPPARRR